MISFNSLTKAQYDALSAITTDRIYFLTDTGELKLNGVDYGTSELSSLVPSGGTVGQVLTKTETGSEWADAQGGSDEPVDYLTFTAQEANSTVALNKSADDPSLSAVLEYSTDGATWSNYTWDGTSGLVITLANVGDFVKFRGDNERFSNSSNYYKFSMTGRIACSGAVDSLLSKNVKDAKLSDYCYQHMFAFCNSLTTAPALPATTLSDYCYQYMFQFCTSMPSVPALPATTLARGCYEYMFSYCYGLTSVSTPPATTLSDYCYQYMFAYCNNLTSVSVPPATTLAQRCYQRIFWSCKELSRIEVSFNTWPDDLAGTSDWVYYIPASGKFYCPYGLPIIRDGSHIPVGWDVIYTDVSENQLLPSGGISEQVLTKTDDGVEWATPQGKVNRAYVELENKTASAPATFEVDFSGKQIQKYPFEDAASGSIAFTVKNSGAAGDGYAPTVELQVPVSGEISTITFPEGAQVVDMPASLTGELSQSRIKKYVTYHDLVFRNEKNFAGHWQTYISHGYSFQELQEYDYFWLEAREDDSTVSCDNFDASYNLSSSFDGLTWTALTGSTIATGVNAGTKIYFIGNTTTLGSRIYYGAWSPYSDKKYAIGGKILSLYNEWIEPVTLTNDYDLSQWQNGKLLEECSVDFGPVKFAYNMFWNCSNLSGLPDGFSVPNMTYANGMFGHCSNLSGLPDGFSVPNMTNTYSMFIDCSSLSALPDSFSCPNTTDTTTMFYECSSLTTIGSNVKIANGADATATDNTYLDKSKITTIGSNFEWFTNATFDGTWNPALGIRNVFPNAVNVGPGWKVYNHYDGE